MSLLAFPLAIVTSNEACQIMRHHLGAIAYYDAGHRPSNPQFGVEFHEKSAAICQIAIHHLEKCHGA